MDPQDNSLTINFDWAPHGTVIADGQTIRFAATPHVPGIYRIDLDQALCYIGEATKLATRFGGYRNPGGSPDTHVPKTNRRVQRRILESLENGQSVTIWICTAATITASNRTEVLPLNDKTHRLLVEATAIVLARRRGWELENLPRR